MKVLPVTSGVAHRLARALLFLLGAAFVPAVSAEVDLNEVLRRVQAQAATEAKTAATREAAFKAELARQQQDRKSVV